MTSSRGAAPRPTRPGPQARVSSCPALEYRPRTAWPGSGPRAAPDARGGRDPWLHGAHGPDRPGAAAVLAAPERRVPHRARHRGDGPAVDRAGGADDRRRGRAAQRGARRRAARRLPPVLPSRPTGSSTSSSSPASPSSPCCRSSTSTARPRIILGGAALVLGVVWWNSAFEKRAPPRPAGRHGAGRIDGPAGRPQRGDRSRRRAPRRRHRQGGPRPHEVRLSDPATNCPSRPARSGRSEGQVTGR